MSRETQVLDAPVAGGTQLVPGVAGQALTETNLTQLVHGQVTMSNDDIINMIQVEAGDQLEAARREAVGAAHESRQRLDLVSQRIQAQLNELKVAYFQPFQEAAESFAKKYKLRMPRKPQYGGEDKQVVTGAELLVTGEQKRTYKLRFSGTFGFLELPTVTVGVPAELAQLLRDRDSLSEQIKEAERTISRIAVALGELPKLGRKAAATMTRRRLEQSAGAQLIESLKTDAAEFVGRTLQQTK